MRIRMRWRGSLNGIAAETFARRKPLVAIKKGCLISM